MNIHEEADELLSTSIEESRLKEEAEKRFKILLKKKEALWKPYRLSVKSEQWKEAHDLLDEIYQTHLDLIEALDEMR
jgi:hypothetical protein